MDDVLQADATVIQLSPSQARANLIESVKTFALRHGVPKAAAMAGLNANTVKAWSRRYQWHVQRILTPAPDLRTHLRRLGAIHSRETIREALEHNKSRSTIALSSYLAATSEELDSAPAKSKLGLTKKAKDLGDLHGRLYPPQTEANSILNIAILTSQKPLVPVDSVDVDTEAEAAS